MREIRIRSNGGGRDRARRLEFARIWEGEIVRGFRFRSNAGGRDRAQIFEFARMCE